MERDTNRCFNKNLLDNNEIKADLMNHWPALRTTGDRAVPLIMGTVRVLLNVKVAEALLSNNYEKEVGMILLYQSSSYSSGISAKSQRPWKKVSVILSDGYAEVECVMWDKPKALNWNKDSIVYVKGVLKEGWKTPVSLTIKEIDKV